MSTNIETEEIVENPEPTATSSIIEGEEETHEGSEKGKNDEMRKIESDWEAIEIEESKTSFSVGGEEEPFVLPVAQESSADRHMVGSILLIERKEKEIGVQDDVPCTAIEDVRIREESVSREGEDDTEIQTLTPEQSILHPAFLTEQQPANPVEFPISTIKPIITACSGAETAGPATVEPVPQGIEVEDDVQEEGVILELPKENPVWDDFISGGEEESISEYSGSESIGGADIPQSVLALAHSEQVVDHIESSSPTSEANYIPDTEAGVEIAALESHTQNTQLEEMEVDGLGDFILEVSTEERLVEDEDKNVSSEEMEPVSEKSEHKEIQESVSAQQKSFDSGSEGQLDPPLLAVILPEAGTGGIDSQDVGRDIDSQDVGLEARPDSMLQKLEHEQFEESNSQVPEPSVFPVLSIEQPKAQPEPTSTANGISQPQAKIEENLVPEWQEQILPEEAKWEERHETTLAQSESVMIAPRSPALEPLVEIPSLAAESTHLLDSKPLVGGGEANTESVPEPDLPKEEEESKEIVQERTESFIAMPTTPPTLDQPVDQAQTSYSAASLPQIEPEWVESMDTEQDTVPPEPPTSLKKDRTRDEKGQPIFM